LDQIRHETQLKLAAY